MRRSLPWLALITLALTGLPAWADQDTDTPAKPDSKDTKQYDKLTKSNRAFAGKLVKLDADKRLLTVEVTYKVPKQDLSTVQHFAQLQAQMVEAQRNRNVARLSQLQFEIEKAKLNMLKDASVKVELDGPDNMKVRTMLLPVELDDKGKPRKFTEKEKREMKGPDPKLPGYTADFDNLKTGQTVEVHLAKQLHKSRSPDTKDSDRPESSRPKIAMIVILADPQP